LGQQAQQYVADGKLVPDDLLISLIDSELLTVGNTVSQSKLCIYKILF
jgi:adenylate kinase